MRREYHRWYSPHLHRDMELLVFGHAGARVLAFPTSRGRFYEWEERGLVAALGHHLHHGWVQLVCVDSVDAESWYAWHAHAGDRAWRHELYDRYVLHEVLPLTEYLNPNPYLIVTGASLGGYHAVNFALKHPEKAGRLLSLSGLCDIRRFVGGHYDVNVYYNNPVDFLPGLGDPGRLAALRRLDIILAVGAADGLRASNEHLSHILWGKGVGNALRVWDGLAHDWPDWAKMLHLYLGGHD